MNVVKLSRIRKEWRNEKEQIRIKGSRPLEIHSRSFEGLENNEECRIGRQGILGDGLVCR